MAVKGRDEHMAVLKEGNGLLGCLATLRLRACYIKTALK